MTAKTLIVVFGAKGSGKDSFANLLADQIQRVERAGLVRRTSFAEPLKLAACFLLGIPLAVSNGTQEAKESSVYYGRSCRSWLQWLGTEIGRRGVAESLWVDRLCDLVVASPEPYAIVSDGRFRNERDLPRERLKGIALVRSVLVRRRAAELVAAADDHLSEAELRDMIAAGESFDFVVENEGSLDDLRVAAGVIAREVAA